MSDYVIKMNLELYNKNNPEDNIGVIYDTATSEEDAESIDVLEKIFVILCRWRIVFKYHILSLPTIYCVYCMHLEISCNIFYIIIPTRIIIKLQNFQIYSKGS